MDQDQPFPCTYPGVFHRNEIEQKHCVRGCARTSYSPPDPYAGPIKALRAAQGFVDTTADDAEALAKMQTFRDNFYQTAVTSRFAAAVPATSRAHLEPPDGYAVALKELKEQK